MKYLLRIRALFNLFSDGLNETNQRGLSGRKNELISEATDMIMKQRVARCHSMYEPRSIVINVPKETNDPIIIIITSLTFGWLISDT